MIAVYGDNCVDRYKGVLPAEFAGGNAVNVAVHLADLNAQVAYFGVFGDDRAGELIREKISRRGVCCSHVETRRGRTAVTLIEVHDGGHVVLEDDVGVQCPLSLSETSMRALMGCNFIHCTPLISWNIEWRAACPKILEEVKFMYSLGKHVSMDFSEAEEPELALLLGRFLSVAFVSRGAECTPNRLEETFQFFHQCGVPETVVTLGAFGSAYGGFGEHMRVPPVTIDPVDTIGAGDAFAAGWLFCRSRGGGVRDCMDKATNLAATVCGYFGAWPNAKISVANIHQTEVDNAGITNSRDRKTRAD